MIRRTLIVVFRSRYYSTWIHGYRLVFSNQNWMRCSDLSSECVIKVYVVELWNCSVSWVHSWRINWLRRSNVFISFGLLIGIKLLCYVKPVTIFRLIRIYNSCNQLLLVIILDGLKCNFLFTIAIKWIIMSLIYRWLSLYARWPVIWR